MAFKLSNRSLAKMEGVDESLVAVVKRAIELTKVDFGVIYGLRTVEEQEKLVAAGKSQTMKSKHLEGRAVDLMAYVDGKGVWELNVYDDLCDANGKLVVELDLTHPLMNCEDCPTFDGYIGAASGTTLTGTTFAFAWRRYEDLEYETEMNCKTLHAKNGKEAVEMCSDNSEIDFIFMDLKMPVMNGFEATKRIRHGQAGERYSNVPIIALTANALASERDACLTGGFTDYMTKPLNPDRLDAMIRSA